MDFDSFTVFYVYFDPKHSEGNSSANVWPSNTRGKVATG